MSKDTPTPTTATVAPSHHCPHQRKDATGMEVCVVCDYAICTACGASFNQRDMGGGPECHQCARIGHYEREIAQCRAWQAERRAAHHWKAPTP